MNTTPCIGFGWPKAPLVLARELGDIVQTSRGCKWKALEKGLNLLATSLTAAPAVTGAPEKGWCLYSRDGAGVWQQRTKPLKPRCRPGQVLHVGVPHWRSIDKQWCWDEFTKRFQGAGGWVYHASLDELSQYNIQWRRCSSYCLPSRAATQWLLCLSAEPQRLLDYTEQHAIEELVESVGGPTRERRRWRHYVCDKYICTSALQSFLTMLSATLKRPVAELLAAWFWRCRFEVVEEPKEC